MPTPRTGPPVARSYGHRLVAAVAAVFFAATGVLFWPSAPASAAPPSLGDQCSVQDWQNPGQWDTCVGKLTDLTADEAQCVEAPTPEAPDSGMAGWFATRPAAATQPGPKGNFTRYGYAGYDYSTYDTGCVNIVRNPDSEFENTVANGEFMVATGIIGAANALRDRAWDPGSMWGWADTLVQNATQAVYSKVFTIFGAITLAAVGLYLLWRSRQSDMNNAMTTAGWAILVMVAVTAIAHWPVRSAHLADSSLIQGLTAVHNAVGPESQTTPADQCRNLDPQACVDHRPPAVRASDTAVDTLLYRNWLRGELGSADSLTAQKYGMVLYDAKSLSWGEADDIKNDPSGKTRQQILSDKQQRWEKVAKQIKTEDPDAYQYLQGTKGMDRVGAGFTAILSAVFFAMFDIVASVLVLLGFLIFRWAVIAAPVLGTVGMLRPASTGIRRLANAVVAAIFNIIIFGTGAAIYLFAVDLIMGTATLPAWLQVVLVWLCGIVGWLLLRPYRRITQLGGGRDATGQVAAAGSWHRTFFRDLRQAATLGIAAPAVESAVERRRRDVTVATTLRPEARHEDPVEARGSGGRPDDSRSSGKAVPSRFSRSPQWKAPDRNEGEPAYAVYRPDSAGPRTADPVQRPESAPIRG